MLLSSLVNCTGQLPIGPKLPLKELVCGLCHLESQVISVTRSALYHLELARQLWMLLDLDSLVTVVLVMGASGLDYCNALCVRLPQKLT